MNNANFGYGCRNNIGNCYFEPINDEIGEIASTKKFDGIFVNEKYCDFSNINLMREEVNEKYDHLILALDENDPTYEARKDSLQTRKEVDLDSIKRKLKKRAFYDIEQKVENVLKSKTAKMIVDFCAEESASVESFAIKRITK